MIKAEVAVDHQHGPIVRVAVGDYSVAVYLMDETGILTGTGRDGGQAQIKVHGPWNEFRAAMISSLSHHENEDNREIDYENALRDAFGI